MTDSHGRCATPTTCPSHHYSDREGECRLCHKHCHQCSGPDYIQCLSCYTDHYLLNGTCVDECPMGFFSGETQRCEPCHPNCLSCMGRHSHECLSCKTHLYREGKECVETCQPGTTTTHSTAPVSPAIPPAKHAQIKGWRTAAHVILETHSQREPVNHSVSWGNTLYLSVKCAVTKFPLDIFAEFILTTEGRCLPCCRSKDRWEEETNVEQQECCNCTQTRGKCVLSSNFALHNLEVEEYPGNLALFITTSILLVLGLVTVVVLLKRSSKRPTTDTAVARGYEKLGHGSGKDSYHGAMTSTSSMYGGQASSSSGHFHEEQLVDLGDGRADREHDEDDEDEDIVYMGQDGTVYRKFRYGQLGEEQEDELEYDDESYNFK
ncbi:hypothetical protein SRHO_G00290510 [Serrasalmus rhombeus]